MEPFLTQGEKIRNRYLLRTYGITLAQYNELLELQADSCAVCKKHRSVFKTNLAVDHDHKTGEIRGLLCNYCNLRVIGRAREAFLFRMAAEYLDKPFTTWFVPKKRKVKKR